MKSINNGYIKLYRSMLDWEWYLDANVFRIFFHLLITVNYEDIKYMGKRVKRGSRIATLPMLSDETNLSVQQIRTALEKLKSTGEITVKTLPQFRIISVSNYNKYQDVTGVVTGEQQASNSRATGKQQASNRQATGEQQDYYIKEIKKERNKEIKEIEESNLESDLKIILSTGDFYQILKADMELWSNTYPTVNVKQELLKMAAWCDSNPTKRKTATGIKRFVTGWLARQERQPEQSKYQKNSSSQGNTGNPFLKVLEDTKNEPR